MEPLHYNKTCFFFSHRQETDRKKNYTKVRESKWSSGSSSAKRRIYCEQFSPKQKNSEIATTTGLLTDFRRKD